jgi:bifunctional non-homologous end joining protein LigD
LDAAFPEIVSALHALPPATLDGELIVPDSDGRSDFEELRRRNLLQRPQMVDEAAARTPAVLVVFDLLELDVNDLRAMPLSERRQALHRHVKPSGRIRLIEHADTYGEAIFHAIASQDHEGIVAKRLDAPYRAGRRFEWLKIKNREYSRREALEWRR